MPLITTEPTEVELSDLKLVGACSFADFFSNNQTVLFGETWERLMHNRVDDELRSHPNRSLALELYPPGFPKDPRWYYCACVEVKDLALPYSSALISRFMPAARYLKFTVEGPVTEIGPAFRQIYDQWLPSAGVKLAGYYDLEFYDERFKGPCNAESRMDILLPLA
jgi:predicted transcriptional regulator YdeE